MSKIKHGKIIEKMEAWAPKKLAYDWDPTGFQLGSLKDQTNNVLITLDVLENVVDEAIDKNANLIISHHPLIFSPLKSIDMNSPKGKTLEKLIKHNITVYTSHTNLDIAEGGVNDLLAKQLNLDKIKPLIVEGNENLYKVAVYTPLSHEKEVREAFNKGGAGHIGNYSHCTFQSIGQGTFKPMEGSDPYSGSIGKLKFADEIKIESIVPEGRLPAVLDEIKKAHPYEEVAHDIFKLKNKGKEYGLGRIGLLKNPMQLSEFIEFVKDSFKLDGLKVTGNVKDTVKKIALLGGSGEKYIVTAKGKGADVYITGDMTFHPAQEAMEMGLNVIDAGHYIEEIMIEASKDYLQSHFQNTNIKIYSSKINTNPFKYY